MQLKEIMRRDVVTIPQETMVNEAARLMEKNNVGCIVILKEGRACGILTDRDIVLKVVARGLDPAVTQVREVMQPDVIWARPEMDILEALRLMSFYRVRRVPVQDEGQVVGIVSLTDLSRVVQDEVDHLLSPPTAPLYRAVP